MKLFRSLFFWIALTSLFGQVAPQDEKVRIFVTDSESWTSGGGVFGADGVLVGGSEGGARPQTAEIIKTFNERCPEFTITMKQTKADYIILLDHEGGKTLVRRDNKVVVFDSEGDAIYSGSTVILGNAVKDACHAIRKTRKVSPASP